MDKRKLSQEPPSLSVEVDRSHGGGGGGGSNTSMTVTLEALHQLAASYFTDRESTLRRLHHLQIASSAIRVRGSRGNAAGVLPPPRGLLASRKKQHTLYKIKVDFPGTLTNKPPPRIFLVCFSLRNIKNTQQQLRFSILKTHSPHHFLKKSSNLRKNVLLTYWVFYCAIRKDRC